MGKGENNGNQHFFLNNDFTFPREALVFTCLHHRSFENTVGKVKEKFLLMSNCSFSYSIVYPSGELSEVYMNIKIVVCKPSQFERVQDFLFRIGLIQILSFKLHFQLLSADTLSLELRVNFVVC